jgi:hypothetical protein
LGTQVNTWQGKEKKQFQILLGWEIPEERMEEDDKPKVIYRTYTASLAPQSALRKHLEGWRGKAFKEDEINPKKGGEGFEMQNILGANCTLSIGTTDNGNDKILSVSTLMKGQKKSKIEGEKIFFDLDDKETFSELDKLSEYWRAQIASSPEYKKLLKEENVDNSSDEVETEEDDDLPF